MKCPAGCGAPITQCNAGCTLPNKWKDLVAKYGHPDRLQRLQATAKAEVERRDTPTVLYFRTPQEYNAALAESAIRAVEQLSLRYRPSEEVEQELAFVELTMRRIRREMPS